MIKDRPFLNWERQFMAPHEYVIARYARLLSAQNDAHHVFRGAGAGLLKDRHLQIRSNT